MTKSAQTILLAQMSALSNLMHGDGWAAFDTLSDEAQDELRALFATLADEFSRVVSAEDSSKEAGQ